MGINLCVSQHNKREGRGGEEEEEERKKNTKDVSNKSQKVSTHLEDPVRAAIEEARIYALTISMWSTKLATSISSGERQFTFSHCKGAGSFQKCLNYAHIEDISLLDPHEKAKPMYVGNKAIFKCDQFPELPPLTMQKCLRILKKCAEPYGLFLENQIMGEEISFRRLAGEEKFIILLVPKHKHEGPKLF